jgi:tRNA-dihydrouridine synthase A
MLTPDVVAEGVAAMIHAVKIPVTVKCRIGVDDHDSYENLCHFIRTVNQGGCNIFIVHARKAWLSGLSPKENREIPPLHYGVVYQLKRDFPDLTFVINGGIKTLADIEAQLPHVDGVMIGREAYTNPYFLHQIEKQFFASEDITRLAVIEKLLPYIENELKNNVKLSHITRHILGLYQGVAGAKGWRRYLSENAWKEGADIEVLRTAMEQVS